MNNTFSWLEFQSVKLGRCGAQRPQVANSGPGLRQMMSASDDDLHKWLVANEEKFEKSSKLCAEEVVTANRLKTPAEWGPSNYKVFEWNGQQNGRSGESGPFSHFYLRGKLQRASIPNNSRSQNNRLLDSLFEIGYIRNIWLIATNTRVDFSIPWTAENKKDPFALRKDDETCQSGILRNNFDCIFYCFKYSKKFLIPYLYTEKLLFTILQALR